MIFIWPSNVKVSCLFFIKMSNQHHGYWILIAIRKPCYIPQGFEPKLSCLPSEHSYNLWTRGSALVTKIRFLFTLDEILEEKVKEILTYPFLNFMYSISFFSTSRFQIHLQRGSCVSLDNLFENFAKSQFIFTKSSFHSHLSSLVLLHRMGFWCVIDWWLWYVLYIDY